MIIERFIKIYASTYVVLMHIRLAHHMRAFGVKKRSGNGNIILKPYPEKRQKVQIYLVRRAGLCKQ